MGIFSITVNAKVNQPPSQIGDNTIVVNHDSTHTFTEANFTTETNPPYLDTDGDAVDKIKIKTLPSTGTLEYNSVAVTLNQEVSMGGVTSGLLKYTSPSGTTAAYQDTIDFDLSDVGTNTFSGLTGTLTMDVLAYINQPPTTGDNSATITHNTTKVFTSADFTTGTTPAYSDPEGDAALNLRVNTLPEFGTLTLDGVEVIDNQVISFADISAGKFAYVSDRNVLTQVDVTFDFSIQDTGSGEFGD